MSDLKIDFEWVDPLAAKGAELRATWARLAIAVDGRPVTRVHDERSHAVRDAVYLPLYPLAEWVAEQWWPLWGEPTSVSFGRPDYDCRHSLVHAREGYALPPLRIEPAGSRVRVSWRPERLVSHQVEFTSDGEAWIETMVAKREFAALIDAVVGRLEAEGLPETRLEQDWLAIRTADAAEQEFCESSGALGLDPYSLTEDRQQEIEEVGRALPGGVLVEFFCAARASAEDFRNDVEEVAAAASRIGKSHVDLTPFRKLREAVVPSGMLQVDLPWEQGYSLARQTRAHLGLDGKALQSIDEIGEAVGTTPTELSSAFSAFSRRELPFAALVGANDKHSPTFALRPGREVSRTFHFCRALFEYLWSPEDSAALVTDANTEQQKRNRAFAAEFLAPSAELRARVRNSFVTSEQTEEIAEEFGVSAFVIAHQLANHDLARVECP